MKIISSIAILLISFCSISVIQAQDLKDFKQQEISVQIGWRFNRILDKRYASTVKKMSQPRFGLRYATETAKKREEIVFSYSATPKNTSPGFLSFKTVMPQVNYTYQRKVGQIWLGGFFDSFTLLNFPKSSTQVFGNNSISYTIAGSLGPAISYEPVLHKTEDHQLTGFNSTQFSVLNYVIRPAYGHPYPEKYLSEEHFSPTQAGMAGPLLKSGKLRTLNKYQMLRIVVGFNYYYKNRVKLGLQYSLYGQKNMNQQRSSTLIQDLFLEASYRY